MAVLILRLTVKGIVEHLPLKLNVTFATFWRPTLPPDRPSLLGSTTSDQVAWFAQLMA